MISAVQEVFSCLRYYKAKKAVVIATTRFTDSCETLADINYVKLIDRTELSSIIEAFRAGDTFAARKIIEAEPRRILESWSETNPATDPTKVKDIAGRSDQAAIEWTLDRVPPERTRTANSARKIP